MQTNVNAPSINSRTLISVGLWVAVFALMVFVVWYTHVSMRNAAAGLAPSEEFQSSASGNWVTSSTWSGGVAPPTSNINGYEITIGAGHSVVTSSTISAQNNVTLVIEEGATLTINGNLSAQNNFTIINSGKLIITGSLIAQNGANVTITGTGKVNISLNGTFGNNATVLVDGNVNVGGSVTLGANGSFSGTGTVGIAGTGCNKWSGPGVCTTGPVVLPVELLNFSAKDNGDGTVKITWETASELNNNFFTIERSSEGTTYDNVGTVKGNGTTKEKKRYDYQDLSAVAGRSYYRLSQTDLDGTTEVFSPVMVEVTSSGATASSISVYPNPLVGRNLTIELPASEVGMVYILNSAGKAIVTQKVDGSTKSIALELESDLAPGLYHVKYKTKSFEKSTTLVKRNGQ
jgi:hypothetical protein